MLSVYSRHYPPCPSSDLNYKRCRCPKWINGLLEKSKLCWRFQIAQRRSVGETTPFCCFSTTQVPA